MNTQDFGGPYWKPGRFRVGENLHLQLCRTFAQKSARVIQEPTQKIETTYSYDQARRMLEEGLGTDMQMRYEYDS